ncbi:MAG TPA: sulfate ABC transporter permease subunit CysT [Opitutales bacterium]|nr:sulfate ABC transporter permease subunit CysT [Opitutales bacterium]
MSNTQLVIIPSPVPARPAPPGGFRAAPIPTRRVLPGFGLTLGYTVLYLGLMVMIPLSAAFIKTAHLSWAEFTAAVANPRAIASYQLSFGASLAAAAFNSVFGLLVAWVLVRYQFPGRKLLDAMVDLPFALPTAVAGIALTFLYNDQGWIGRFMAGSPFWIKIAYTPIGVWVALTFISLPFVVRTLQPVIEELEVELEEASAMLGATRWQTFERVIFPVLLPPLLTGFALAFARALGEYGSVVFISGGLPFKTQITPQLIYEQLDQYNYAQATAIAVVMLVVSFLILLAINLLQRWARQRTGVGVTQN